MLKKIINILPLIAVILIITTGQLYSQINPQVNLGINNAPPGSTNEEQKDEEVDVIMWKTPPYTIGRYFRALGHKDSMSISRMAIGSMILPGTAQIYNNQKWKLPIVYGTIGGFVGGAIASNMSYQRNGKESARTMRDLMIGGAVVSYWWSVLDGVVSFKSPERPLPARASLFSALVPGLGQAYNGDYWKIPIFYTGFVVSGYCWSFNQTQYKRYRDMYKQAVLDPENYTGHLTPDNIKWYRDQHRRLRDYSILATALIYVLNIVDANVFAHFSNFDISDDISLKVEPATIKPIVTKPAMNNYMTQSFGFKMNLNF